MLSLLDVEILNCRWFFLSNFSKETNCLFPSPDRGGILVSRWLSGGEIKPKAGTMFDKKANCSAPKKT
jgi:hypothetical protein